MFRTKNAVLKLSQQTAEFKEAFSFFRQRWRQHFDHQGVGHSHAILDQNPTEAQLQDMINGVDADGNGTIDFPEFSSLMARKMNDADTEEELGHGRRKSLRLSRYSIVMVMVSSAVLMTNLTELRHVMTNLGKKLTDKGSVSRTC